MNVSERVVLRDKKQLLQHRKRHPAAFERIITHGDHLIRYYASHPAFLLGEALKVELGKSGEAIERLIFFQAFDEGWYVCAIDEQAHLREFIGALSEIETLFSYELHCASHVLVASEGMPFLPQKQVSIPPLTPNMWQDFSLDAYQKKNLIRPAAVVAMGILVAAVSGWFKFIDTPPPVVVVPAEIQTDEATFIEEFTAQPLAYPLLMNALAMAVESQSLPSSMVLKGLSYDPSAQRLIGEVDKGHSRIKTRREWTDASVERQVHWDEVGGQLVSPTVPMARWQGVVVDEFLPAWVDALESFNVKVMAKSVTHHGGLTGYAYQLSFNGELGALSLFAPVLNANFITMTSFSMTLAGEANAQLTADIMIQGTQHDR